MALAALDLLPHRLSLQRIREAHRHVDPRFVDSPQARCPVLSRWLGCDLVLKDDAANPIGCFKGRGAHHYVALRPDDKPMACASAGNFGMGLAQACARHRVPLTVFVSRHANAVKVDGIRRHGARIEVAGDDFDAAKAAARVHAAVHGLRFVEDGRDVEISEGAGSIGVELLAAFPRLDAVVLPLGNGALLAGVGRWIKAHSPHTEVIAACAAAAPAMQLALRGDDWRGARADSVADGIAVREPVPEALADLAPLLDDVIAVPDAGLLAAMRELHASTGRLAEPSAVAGLAAIDARRARFAGRTVATVLTGRNLTREQIDAWLTH